MTTTSYCARKAREIDDLCGEFPRTHQMESLTALLENMLEDQRSAVVRDLIARGHESPALAKIVHAAAIEP